MRLILICLFLNSSIFCFSQKVELEIDLQSCIKFAFESSLNSIIADNTYESSYWEYRSYKVGKLPSFNLNSGTQYNHSYTERYDFESNIDLFRSMQSFSSNASLSVKQSIGATGGSLDFSSNLNYLLNNGENRYTQFSGSILRLSYSQSLFAMNNAKWQKKTEPMKFKKAQKDYLYTREGISEIAVQYFFDLILAQTEVEMAIENMLSIDTLYNIGIERERISTIASADVSTLKMDLLNAINQIETAKLELKHKNFQFNLFLNIPKETTIKAILPVLLPDLNINIDEAIDIAWKYNSAYLNSELSIIEAEKNIESIRRSLFSASMSASLGLNQAADNIAGVYKNPSQQEAISINMSIPLYDWGMRGGRLKMAENRLEAAKLTEEQSIISMEFEIISTIEKFNTQLSILKRNKEAIQFALDAYKNLKDRFVIGKSDANSVHIASRRLMEANSLYIRSIEEYWLLYYKIRKLTLFDFENNQPLAL